MRLICLAILLMVSAIVSNSSAADPHWPGWLGPQRNGWVAGFQPPSQWPEKLQRKWQVEVGTGYGSPLVDGDRVYQHARQGENEVVWCLDMDTGNMNWNQRYAVPFKMGGGGERHGKGPKGCPILADGRLFTMSITGTVSAWDAATGEPLWQSDVSTRFKRPHPYWGTSTSPVVDGDRVIAHFGTDNDGALIALDVQSGKPVWTNGKDGPDYSSPLLAQLGGVRQVIEWNQRVLAAVESATGQTLWEFPFPHVGTNQNMPTPTLYDGRILLGAENRGIRCLQPELKDGSWTVKQLWEQPKLALDMSTAVINDGLLYGFSHYDTGRLFCLDPEDGEVIWTGPPRTGQNVTFLAMPEYIAALINDGELRIIKATRNGYEVVVSYRVSDKQTWAPPVLTSGGLLIKDTNTLALWSIPN